MVDGQSTGISGSGPVSNFTLAGLTAGVYILNLSVVTNGGCQYLSEPIQMTITNCNCEGLTLPDGPFVCAGVDANGGITYSFDLNTNWPGSPNATLVVTPDFGGITLTTNTLTQITGTLYVPAPARNNICFTYTYTDPEPTNSCQTVYCFKLPDCQIITNPCDFDISLGTPVCLGQDALHQETYGITLHTTASVIFNTSFSSAQGTCSFFPSSISAGSNVYSGIFKDISPVDNTFCFQVNAVNSETQQLCMRQFCIDRPVCNGGNTDFRQSKFWHQSSLELSPNPVKNNLSINYNCGSEICDELIITDLFNHILQTHTLEPNGNHIILDLENLSSGVYLVKLMSKNNVQVVEKFIIMK